MEIGILSDTHDNLEQTRRATALFRERGIRTVIHAGDFCSPFSVLEFRGFELHTVFGNNDGDHYRILKKTEEIGGTHHGELAELDLGGMRIAVYHGTQPAITAALIGCGEWDVVISGHTHEAVIEQRGNTLHINPGSTHGFGDGGTVVILDTEKLVANLLPLTSV